jgi:hypothetical protein
VIVNVGFPGVRLVIGYPDVTLRSSVIRSS